MEYLNCNSGPSARRNQSDTSDTFLHQQSLCYGSTVTTFDKLKVEISDGLAEVVINRPQKANALNQATWNAIGEAFTWLDQETAVRAIVLHGAGKGFCSGIDFSMMMQIVSDASKRDDGEKQEYLLQTIRELQASFTKVEKCRKPVIAAIHGVCYGGGVDLITACDIRLGSQDAVFSIKEVDLGIVADVGTLQRLPTIIGQGLSRELAFTGRNVSGPEAKEIGLLNHVYADHETLLHTAREMGQTIAKKSPLTVRGIKQVMNYCRDQSVQNGLEYVATWNAGMLLTRDGQESFAAMLEKRTPKYKD